MVKAGASCQSFTERMNVVTFKLVGILGEGGGAARAERATYPTSSSSVPTTLYLRV